MSRSNAAAAPITDNTGGDQCEYQGSSEPERIGDSEPELVASDVRAKMEKEQVPPHVILWAFVRRDESGYLHDAELMANGTRLRYDRERHRFLISFDNLIVDDLSPLEFVRFIRQLRKVSTQIVFKLETRLNGVRGRARRVWA